MNSGDGEPFHVRRGASALWQRIVKRRREQRRQRREPWPAPRRLVPQSPRLVQYPLEGRAAPAGRPDRRVYGSLAGTLPPMGGGGGAKGFSPRGKYWQPFSPFFAPPRGKRTGPRA